MSTGSRGASIGKAVDEGPLEEVIRRFEEGWIQQPRSRIDETI